MVPKIQPKSKAATWLLRYRFAIIIFLFLIVIPIISISVFYVSTYERFKGTTFDDERITSFTAMDYDVEDNENQHQLFVVSDANITVYIKLIKIVDPLSQGDSDRVYHFQAKYEKKNNINLNSEPDIEIVLDADWGDFRSTGRSFRPSSTKYWSGTNNVTHNHNFPLSPAWFVVINEPTIYVKLSYSFQPAIGNEARTQVTYYSGVLSNVTPSDVLDKQANDNK